MCCGKPVTGIGNVPKWDPPRRKHKLLTEKDKVLEVVMDADDDEDDEKNEKDEIASGNNGDASAPPKYFDEWNNVRFQRLPRAKTLEQWII